MLFGKVYKFEHFKNVSKSIELLRMPLDITRLADNSLLIHIFNDTLGSTLLLHPSITLLAKLPYLGKSSSHETLEGCLTPKAENINPIIIPAKNINMYPILL